MYHGRFGRRATQFGLMTNVFCILGKNDSCYVPCLTVIAAAAKSGRLKERRNCGISDKTAVVHDVAAW